MRRSAGIGGCIVVQGAFCTSTLRHRSCLSVNSREWRYSKCQTASFTFLEKKTFVDMCDSIDIYMTSHIQAYHPPPNLILIMMRQPKKPASLQNCFLLVSYPKSSSQAFSCSRNARSLSAHPKHKRNVKQLFASEVACAVQWHRSSRKRRRAIQERT